MANGNRDVSLVIRARNEASRALDTVSTALDELRKSQRGVQDGSERTGSTLQQLGTALGRLRQQVGGASAMDRLSNSMEKASASVSKLQSSIAGIAADQQRLAGEIGKTEATIGRLDARQQKLTQTLQNQQAATERARNNMVALNAEVERGQGALQRSARDTQQFTDRLTRQHNALERTRSQYRQLAQQILAAENPGNRLLNQFEKTEGQLRRQSNALERTKADYRTYIDQIDRLRAAMPQLRQAQDQANASFEKAQGAQQRTVRALDHVNRAARQSATQLTGLQRSSDRNVAALEKQGAALERARTELRALGVDSDKANAALTKVGSTVRGQLLRSLRDSQQQLAQYRQEWERATAVIGRSMAGSGGMGPPTRETSNQLEIARRAKQAYEEQQVAIQRMRTALREAGTDVDRLAKAQQTFIAAQERTRSRTEALTAAQRQQAAAIAQAGAASRGAAAAGSAEAAAHLRVTGALRQKTGATRESTAAMEALQQRGRAAMTWAQRLRGEVVALTLSYVGLYAAINQLRGVTDAFLMIEAAQNRMLVAFNGDDALSAREMRWVREEADRLGIQVGVLAQEYSKFAIAARGSTIEGAEARRVFQSVAEAARVNKLSIDQMEGTYLALSQMMSKGVVSMEELRRQMGDRLYGAFTLAAEAMGITAQELDKLVSTGSLFTDRFLPRFADRLDEVFGPQLSDSLDTFTTDLGRFQNEILKTQLRVAEAGFVDGLRDALISLSEFFQSDEGVRFFEVLGQAAGGLARIMAEIPRYFQEIAFVLSLLVGMRTAAFIGTLAERFRLMLAAARPLPATLHGTAAAARGATAAQQGLNASTAAATPLLLRMQTALRGTAAALATAQGRAVAMTRVMTGLRAAMAFVGGVPGLIVTGISLALATWVGRTNDVVDVTGQHEQQMNRLIDTYSRVRESAGDWAQAVEDGLGGITLDQARKNFRDQVEGMAGAAEDAFRAAGGRIESSMAVLRMMSGPLSSMGPGYQLSEVEQQVLSLGRQLKSGEITARDYQKALNDMLRDRTTPRRLRDLIENASDMTQGMVDAEQRVVEAAAAVLELGGEVDELNPLLRDLVPNLEDLAREAGLLVDLEPADPFEALSRQLDILRGKVPSLTDELKLMEQLSEIDQILNTAEAIEGLDQTSEAFLRFLNLAKQAKAEIRDAFDAKQFRDAAQLLGAPGANSAQLSASLIRQREGFRETPYFDVNALRVGFGSDTITLADGSIQKVVEGMRVSVADANRDLERRIGEFQSVVRRQVGDEAWRGMNPQQQAVLTSNAYNYGSLTPELVAAVRSGTTEGVVEALRRQATHNDGVNADRRNEEAFLFGQAGSINEDAVRRFVDDQIKAAEQQAERAAEYNVQLDRTLERRAEDLRYVDGITRQMAIQRALEDERERAIRVGVELSAEQLGLIEANAAAAWDQKAAEDAIRLSKERQAEADQRINMLQQHRRDLMEQIEFYQNQGDQSAVENLRPQLEATNQVLREAIDLQITFWEAARGGPDGEQAEAALARLQNLRNSLVETGQLALLTSNNLGQTFGQHLVTGVNGFLDKIRETGDVFGSLRDGFLQFASDFLLQIAKMIAQQAIFNAISGAFGGAGGFWGGVVRGITAGVNHEGGIAGAAGPSRTVSPAWFTNALRYHSGGIAGLRPNEVPSILERGEEVLTADDPRHRDNGGGGGSLNVKNVNVFDAADVMAQAMSDVRGQKVILNYIKANPSAVRGALGV